MCTDSYYAVAFGTCASPKTLFWARVVSQALKGCFRVLALGWLRAAMSFLSGCHSTETLGRGLDLVRSNSLACICDPELQRMEQELQDT